jgi:hypothetical protein
MFSKIKLGIFATFFVTFMVAATMYNGLTNANAQVAIDRTNNVGSFSLLKNFAFAKQSNTAGAITTGANTITTGAATSTANANGGAGGSIFGVPLPGGSGGTAESVASSGGNSINIGHIQKNKAFAFQSAGGSSSCLICNVALADQSNSAGAITTGANTITTGAATSTANANGGSGIFGGDGGEAFSAASSGGNSINVGHVQTNSATAFQIIR